VVSFKPKKCKEIQKKERKNPIKKNGYSEDFGIPFILFFLNLGLGSIRVLDGFYFSIIVE